MAFLPVVPLLSVLAVQAADPGTFEQRLADIRRSGATRRLEVAASLEQEKMYRLAREEYGKILRIISDHEWAREKLGFEREGERWIARPGQGLPVCNEPKGVQFRDHYKTYLDELAALHRELAKEYRSLAKWCGERSLAEQRRQALQLVLENAPEDTEAQRALGWIWMERGRRYLPPSTSDLVRRLLGWRKATTGAEYREKTEAEGIRASKHTKRSSAHFVFESPFLTQKDLGELIQVAEATFDAWSAFFDWKPSQSDWKMDILVLKERRDFEAFVDIVDKDDEAERRFDRQLGGAYYGRNGYAHLYWDMEDARDAVAHKVLEQVNETRLSWIDESLAIAITREYTGGFTGCVSQDTQAGSGPFDRGTWQVQLRKLVERGEDPEAVVIFGSGVNELKGERGAKAWSIHEFLMRVHPDRFKKFITATYEVLEDRTRTALEQSFGWSPEELDEYWRIYVLVRY